MLSAQTLLITANDQPVALAGVMSEETEVHDGTQSLVRLRLARFGCNPPLCS